MQRVGSARPALISSASKLCRYSTENAPQPPRLLVKEWGGIVIPSREEIQEKAARRKAETQKPTHTTDISYLKNASERSLAGRLARAEANSIPKPAVSTLSQEEIQALTKKRREARLARETGDTAKLAEKANAVLRDFSPIAVSKAIYAAMDAPRPLPQSSNPSIIPEIQRRPPLTSFATTNPPVRHDWEQPPPAQVPSQKSPSSQPRVAVSQEKVPVSIKPSENSNLLEQFSAPIVNDPENPQNVTNKKGEKIVETHPASQRELLSAAIARRREERLRREARGSAFSLPSEGGFEGGSSTTPLEDMASSIAKRRAERLKRQQLGAEGNMSQEYDGRFSSNRQRQGPRLGSKSNHSRAGSRAEAVSEKELEIALGAEQEAEVPGNFGPEFSGPEPISNTLSEIFSNSSSTTTSYLNAVSTAVSNQLAAHPSPVATNYSRYVSKAMKPLFSTPPVELGPVDFARLTLSHHGGISLPKRRQAVDIITQASARMRPASTHVSKGPAQAQAAA
ncbi:hypothetical protein GALMADRAFT_261384 [Galerina marginata CBS 339.88]|uniref:Uncharacterized protein n=1 Tax=Galerina marginata (strain CBS 339.88) TaxID=685588 RepID=A0A067U2S1_GALM3|nr:hypothetical protein GALMADRAFT_261384 [Galerina marginata CBS 339.88]